MPHSRIILHIDMNCFYASVEAKYNPEIKGKPVAIAGNVEERRGIIVTSSYEARAKGIYTTMPLWQAKKLCPNLIVLPPDFPKYRKESQMIFELLNRYTDLVEPVSIDEGYIDITSQASRALQTAKQIQTSINNQLGLPNSIGIAPNKFLAKMASDMKKPMGLTIIRKRDIPTKLWPLNVEEMHGIGPSTQKKLNNLNIYTIKQLANTQKHIIKNKLGSVGQKLWERANGIDDRPVDPGAWSEFKSISRSTTLPRDYDNEHELLQVLKQLSISLETKMNEKEVLAKGIQLTIRYKNRDTITRSQTHDHPIGKSKNICEIAKQLLKQNWNEGEAVRLLGITAHHLISQDEAYEQLDIFNFGNTIKEKQISDTISEIETKFGKDMIKKGFDKK